MISWIRIETKIGDDPSIARIAAALRVKLPTAVGLVVGVLCKLPQHAKDGALGAVPDSLIEKWAGWDGKVGRFAQAFRAELCTEAGVVRTWEELNGAPIREAEADAERKRRQREEKRKAKAASDRPPDNRRTVHRTEAGAADGSPLRRDVTGEKLSAPHGAERASPPASPESPNPSLAPEGARRVGPRINRGMESVGEILQRAVANG